MVKERTEAQEKALQRQNEKRKGAPMFSAVRLDTVEQKERVDNVFSQFGTRKAALLLATKLLEKELNRS